MFVSFLTSCVSGSSQRHRQPSAPLTPKAGEGNNSQSNSVDDSQAQSSIDRDQLLSFFTRQIEEETEILPSDHALIDELISKSPRTTIEEAVLVIAGLKTVMAHHRTKAQFEEVDLFGEQDKAAATAGEDGKPDSVQKEMDRLGVDLLSHLRVNPMLQSIKVYSLSVKSVQLGDTPEYKTRVVEVVKDKVKGWAMLHQYVSNITIDSVTSSSVSAEVVDPRSVADLREADLTIVEAERMAQRKKYQEAVELAQSVGTNSPLHPTASEKVKEFSNLAVMDLRRKAALAFQNAMPVHDLKIKQTYLKEAKGYLELALSSYPDADQLSKIKENLAVISRDLSNINDQLGESD